MLSVFNSPFARLTALMQGVEPKLSPINLSVGEPQHALPSFVGEVLAQHVSSLNQYPLQKGTQEYRTSVAQWIARRYAGAQLDPETQVIVLNGSREGLFYAAQAAALYPAVVGRRKLLMPNPFYPVYAGAAVCAHYEPVFLSSTSQTGFLPDLDALSADLLQQTAAFYLCSPANPQGAIASDAYLTRALNLARHYGFLLFVDECYSEIYSDQAPVGAFEVATRTNSMDNLVVFNSLSKRSNLAGLRCGFAAGDAQFIAHLSAVRNVIGPQVPLPVQAVGARAWADEDHVVKNRMLYQEKFQRAGEILGHLPEFQIPQGGFFLWLPIASFGRDEDIALRLWREGGLRVIPGSYLAQNAPDGSNPGRDYVRIALVHDLPVMTEALRRVASLLTPSR